MCPQAAMYLNSGTQFVNNKINTAKEVRNYIQTINSGFCRKVFMPLKMSTRD